MSRRHIYFNSTKKKCTKCSRWKRFDLFYREEKGTLKLTSACKFCINKKNKKWELDNKKDTKISRKIWRAKNSEKIRNQNHIWNMNNKKRASKTSKAWKKKNPDRVLIMMENRRSRVLGNGGIISAKDWEELKNTYKYTCLCCHKKEPEIVLTLDHIIPISLGGKNSINNVQPLCQSCNSKKHVKIIDYRKGLNNNEKKSFV